MNNKCLSDWDWIGDNEVAVEKTDVFFRNFSDGVYSRSMYFGAISYKQARDFVSACFESFRNKRDFPFSDLYPVIDSIIDVVFESPASILWVTKTKQPSDYLFEHPISVCILSVCIGRLLNMPRHDLESLAISSLLFDIGNVSIPINLFQSCEIYTSDDTDLMRDHTRLGRRILEGRMDVYAGASEVAYSHHERLDGSGYPLGITGDKISLFSRIVAVSDVYDAMTSEKAHMKSRIPGDALLYLKDNAGVKFDSDVVSALDNIVNIYRY